MKKTTFRNLLFILLLVFLLLGACGKATDPEATASETIQETESEVQPEPSAQPEPEPESEPEPTPPVLDLDLSVDSGNADEIAADSLSTDYPELERLDLRGRGLADFGFLEGLKKLQWVDLRGNELSTDAYDALVDAHPDWIILWEVPMGGERFDAAIEALPADSIDPALLHYFPNVKAADLRSSSMTPEEMAALTQANPDKELLFAFNLCGVDTDSTATELDIGGNPLEGPEDVLPYLSFLPHLTKLDMCGCGLSNEEMEILMAARPDVKFVWIVSMDVWTLRTDTVAFSSQSSQENPNKITSEDLEVLKYCHDLVALDLGHQAITDITRIGELENLRILILADNKVSDLSPLANLKELRYLELFKNYDITDITPLTGLEHLWDINLFYCIGITDFTPFLQMDCIQRLWLSETKCPDDFIEEMNRLHPDTVVFRAFQCGATYGGWRDHPRFFAMRDMYDNDYVNEEFLK